MPAVNERPRDGGNGGKKMKTRRERPSRDSLQRQANALTAIVETLVRRAGGAEQIAVELEMSGRYGVEARTLAAFMLQRMGGG